MLRYLIRAYSEKRLIEARTGASAACFMVNGSASGGASDGARLDKYTVAVARPRKKT